MGGRSRRPAVGAHMCRPPSPCLLAHAAPAAGVPAPFPAAAPTCACHSVGNLCTGGARPDGQLPGTHQAWGEGGGGGPRRPAAVQRRQDAQVRAGLALPTHAMHADWLCARLQRLGPDRHHNPCCCACVMLQGCGAAGGGRGLLAGRRGSQVVRTPACQGVAERAVRGRRGLGSPAQQGTRMPGQVAATPAGCPITAGGSAALPPRPSWRPSPPPPSPPLACRQVRPARGAGARLHRGPRARLV